jgi:hypothetical protein
VREGDGHIRVALHERGRIVMGPFGRRDGHMWVEGKGTL